MATIAELVTTAPDPTHGIVIASRAATAGVWRIALEVADPLAGESIVFHDLSGHYEWDELQRGAAEYMGRYRAMVVDVMLQADDDRLAPWGQDTSALFGVDVPLGAGLIMRLAWVRVVGGVSVEWEPIWTGRVETWGDASWALGQIRQHRVTVIDTLNDLVNVPVPAGWDLSYESRIGGEFGILATSSWPFGHSIYGGTDSIPELPARDEQPSAINEIDATTWPLGLVWHTLRDGTMAVHPAPFDELHGVAWPNPTTAAYPDGLVFSYNPDLTDVSYITDDSGQQFGIEDTSRGVINTITATMPSGVYPIDDAPSRSKHGLRPVAFSWIVDNEPAVDQMLAARKGSTKQAMPLRAHSFLSGFWPAMSLIKEFDPVRIVHASSETGLVITATGWVRSVNERRDVLRDNDLVQVSTVQVDIVSAETSEALLPVENLALNSQPGNFARFTWSNPSGQPVAPTDTQIRVLGYSSIWIDWPYPLTTWDSGPLSPSTSYTMQVRLVRKVNGITTHQSPTREVTFTSRPPFVPEIVPGGDPGDSNVDIPGDGECEIEWEIQENDGTGWVTIESGDQDDLVLGDDGLYHLPVDLDNAMFDDDKLYRVRYREDCGDGWSDWINGPATDPPDDWTDPCVTPPAFSNPPFDDPDLLVYVPKICSEVED